MGHFNIQKEQIVDRAVFLRQLHAVGEPVDLQFLSVLTAVPLQILLQLPGAGLVILRNGDAEHKIPPLCTKRSSE